MEVKNSQTIREAAYGIGYWGIYSKSTAPDTMLGEEAVWVTAQELKLIPVQVKEGIDETIPQFQMGFPSGAVASCLSLTPMTDLE